MDIRTFNELYDRHLDTSDIRDKILNVSYGFDERHKMDIYYPDEGNMPYKTVVFFHGGGFFKGDKGRYQLAGALQGVYRGFAVISVNYRLVTTDPFPAYANDAKAAVRYIVEHAEELHLDVSRMAVWGESSGAYLAILCGVTDTDETFEDYLINHCHKRIHFRSIIDWYCPYEVELQDKTQMKEIMLKNHTLAFGEDSETAADLERKSLLKQYFHDDMPALLIQQGAKDPIVSVEASEKLKDDYASASPSSRVEMDVFEDNHHGVAEFSNASNLNRVFAFIEDSFL